MTNIIKPQFITFEGGEGSGKSTQSKMLYEFLTAKGIKVLHTREVGGTAEAEKIRNFLLFDNLLPMTELLLIMAARYEHINKVIIPSLLKGIWVICDRFIDSTVCYQGNESSLTIDEIFNLHDMLMRYQDRKMKESYSAHGLIPDLTFFMDLPPEIGLARAGKRGDTNKFEDKDIIFHANVYEQFKSIARLHSDRVVTINCVDKTADDIHEIIIGKIFF